MALSALISKTLSTDCFWPKEAVREAMKLGAIYCDLEELEDCGLLILALQEFYRISPECSEYSMQRGVRI